MTDPDTLTIMLRDGPKRVDDMTRDELIEAIYLIAQLSREEHNEFRRRLGLGQRRSA